MPLLLTRFRVDLLLLAVAASWGSTYLAAKELITPGSVIALLAIRMLLAATLMVLIVVARKSSFTRAEIRTGVILGLLLSAVFVFETFGIAHTSATNAGLIISLTIVFTPLLESVTSGRRLPRSFFGAALVAIIGVALLAGNGGFHTPALGDLLIVIAAIVRAVHVTSMQKLSSGKPMDSLRLTTVQLATCAVVFCVASMFTGTPIPVYVGQLDAGDAALLLYLVVICTVFAFFIQTWAVRRTSPSRVSLLLGTEPVWAVIVGVAIARDELTFVGWVGIALVLVGTGFGRSIEQRDRELVGQLS